MSTNLIGKSAAWQQATYAVKRQAHCLANTYAWSAKLLLIGIALISLFALLPTQAQAQAVCPTGACVTTGSRLTSVDSEQGVLLDALLGDLLGADLNLTALDANGLAQGSVGLEELLDDLQLDLGAATPEQVLTTDITLAQLLAAAADVGNDAVTITALDNLAANVNLPTGTIQLGDLLQIATPDGALSNIDLNALDLVVGAVQLFNSDNIVSTPAPIAISGSELGLQSIINSITVQAQVVEPPVFVCGLTGAQFYSAGVRLKLHVDLVDVNLDTTTLINTLTSLLGSNVEATATVGQLDLYVDVARGAGTIGVINALTNAVTIQATPGVADLYLGTISDAVFFNRTHVIVPATDLSFANIISLTLKATTPAIPPLVPAVTLLDVSANIGAKSFAEGDNPTAQTLNFTGPYPQTLTANTSANFVADLVQDLVNNLEINVGAFVGTNILGTPVTDLLNGALPTLLDTMVGTALDTDILPIDELLNEVVDPLLEDLGIALGEMDVTVNGLVPICDTDGDTVPDLLDLDDDGDGILDADEGNGTVNTDGDSLADSLDTDSDNDSVPDATEGHDANHDGLPDRVPTGNDDDQDGLNDAFDPDFGGASAPRPDTDGDGSRDFQDANDDNDTFNTINEDANNNGNPTDDDSDSDGRPNYLDVANVNPCIPDATRPGCAVLDTDNDGIPNPTDADDDGDGILDTNEGNGIVNTDGDSQPDSLDLDSDNDNVPDRTEGHDADHNGQPDRVPTGADLDQDGIDNAFDPNQGGTAAPRPDTDGDGKRDFQDANDDNDAINTINEDSNNNGNPTDDDIDADGRPNYLDINNTNACIPNANRPGCNPNDTDQDGIPDATDTDDDGDGILDSDEGSGDTDGDGTPNTLDLDSDNDSVPDATEAHDADHNGQPDRTPSGADTDQDGVDNAYDPDQGGTPAPRPDTDEDGAPDFLDMNDDGDAVNTINEDADNNGTPTNDDSDGDGRPNYLDIANGDACVPDANSSACNPDPNNPCVPNANAVACPTGDTDDDDTPNGTDPAPLNPCVPNPNALACTTGDPDDDDTPNGTDPAPLDPCIPNPNAFACDNDDDDVTNDNDPSPTNPCVPNANALACSTGDSDNDGTPNGTDPAPLNPCIPNANSAACIAGRPPIYLPMVVHQPQIFAAPRINDAPE